MTLLHLPINTFFINFFIVFFIILFFIYIKVSENLPAKFYQESKEKLQKMLAKDIKISLKNKKKKSNNMVVNVAKIF